MSSVPAVVAALVALGRTALDLNWQVIDGPIGTAPASRERVLLVGDEEIVSAVDFNNLAGSVMDDRYTVPMLVSVSLPGPDSLPTARSEALAAFDAVVAALLANRSLGGAVMQATPTGERRVQQFASDNGRSCAVRFYIDVYAEIT